MSEKHICEKCKALGWIEECTVDANGDHHSFNDEPSQITLSGTKFWHHKGQKHRVGKPAVVHPTMFEKWYLHGRLHREENPAVVYKELYERHGYMDEWWYEGFRARIINFSLISSGQVTFPEVGKQLYVSRKRNVDKAIIVLGIYPDRWERFVAKVLLGGAKKRYVIFLV